MKRTEEELQNEFDELQKTYVITAFKFLSILSMLNSARLVLKGTKTGAILGFISALTTMSSFFNPKTLQSLPQWMKYVGSAAPLISFAESCYNEPKRIDYPIIRNIPILTLGSAAIASFTSWIFKYRVLPNYWPKSTEDNKGAENNWKIKEGLAAGYMAIILGLTFALNKLVPDPKVEKQKKREQDARQQADDLQREQEWTYQKQLNDYNQQWDDHNQRWRAYSQQWFAYQQREQDRENVREEAINLFNKGQAYKHDPIKGKTISDSWMGLEKMLKWLEDGGEVKIKPYSKHDEAKFISMPPPIARPQEPQRFTAEKPTRPQRLVQPKQEVELIKQLLDSTIHKPISIGISTVLSYFSGLFSSKESNQKPEDKLNEDSQSFGALSQEPPPLFENISNSETSSQTSEDEILENRSPDLILDDVVNSFFEAQNQELAPVSSNNSNSSFETSSQAPEVNKELALVPYKRNQNVFRDSKHNVLDNLDKIRELYLSLPPSKKKGIFFGPLFKNFGKINTGHQHDMRTNVENIIKFFSYLGPRHPLFKTEIKIDYTIENAAQPGENGPKFY